MRRAFITGIGGQDGSYLAELLLDKGYEVLGTVLGDPADHPALDGIRERITFVDAEAPPDVEVDELYHLAGVSFVPPWWEDPVELTGQATTSIVALLEALRSASPAARLFYACSSEIYAGTDEEPQRETTPPAPLTPYGAAKAFGLYAVQAFRARYGLHASTGILFNHESPRRPEHFVTRKITRSAAAISLGLEESVTLGNLDTRRDWGFAGDYVRAMWLMLQQDEADDYVVATGEAHTVRELAEAAFTAVGLDWREYVRVDEALGRGATDAPVLVGDASKARERLDWHPEVGFEELVALMVQTDLTTFSQESLLRTDRSFQTDAGQSPSS